eukprot:6187094-Pleurochrysis_carterae.AAC.3
MRTRALAECAVETWRAARRHESARFGLAHPRLHPRLRPELRRAPSCACCSCAGAQLRRCCQFECVQGPFVYWTAASESRSILEEGRSA